MSLRWLVKVEGTMSEFVGCQSRKRVNQRGAGQPNQMSKKGAFSYFIQSISALRLCQNARCRLLIVCWSWYVPGSPKLPRHPAATREEHISVITYHLEAIIVFEVNATVTGHGFANIWMNTPGFVTNRLAISTKKIWRARTT